MEAKLTKRFELSGVDISNADNVVLVFMSIAISLKRMADILTEAWSVEKADEEIRKEFDDVNPHTENQ